MKKIAILILLTSFVQLITVSLCAVNQSAAKPFTIGTKTANTMDIQFDVPDFEIEEEALAGIVYNKIRLAESGFLLENGMPELPVLTATIAIPNHGQVQIELVDTHQKMIQHVIPYPSQDGNTESSTRGVTINQSYYEGSEIYPLEVIKYSDPQILRDFRVITVQIQPFAWNAATHELIVRDRVNFRLRFNDTAGINELDGPQIVSESFKNIYESMILNFDDYRDVMIANTPPRYLIIHGAYTDQNFQTKLSDFAFWKKQKGADVRVVSTAVTGNTTTQIKAFIQNIYNDVNARPDFIVLVGDTSGSFSIPTWPETFSSYGGQGDYPYQHLAGNDYLGDVFLGRISAESTSQLDVIFSKIYFYEKYINVASAQWLNKMLLVGDTSPSGQSVVYTNKYMKELGQHYNPDYTFTELYGDSPSVASMDQAINQGVGFFNYRGYIGMSGWNPGGSLVNGTKLPHTIIITCSTGSFGGGQTSTTEEFIRLGTPTVPAGAVTSIGMYTSGTHTMFNNALNMGIVSGIFTHNMRTMGEALLNGKLFLSEVYHQNHDNTVKYFAHWCNLMGDPTMEVYCKIPNTFATNAPSILPAGTNNLELYIIDQNSVPVEDACITVSQSNMIMARGYSDANGRVVLLLNSTLSAANAIVTVSKHEFKPLQQSITIDGSGSLVAGVSMIDDDTVGNSIGNGDYAANSGETLEILFSLRNSTNSTINNVTGHATCSSPYITVVNDSMNFASIDPGTTNYSLIPILVQVASNCPNNTIIRFDMHLTDSADSLYSVPSFVTVTDAFMSFVAYQVIDTNNQALDPNETASLSLTLKNNGTVPIDNLYGMLVTQNDLVQVQDNIGYFGNVLVGAQTTTIDDLFLLLGREHMLPGMLIPMRLKLYNANGFLQWIDFTLTVGAVAAHDPLGPDAYGYVIYDITDTDYEECPVYDWIGIAPAEGGAGTALAITDNGTSSDEGDPVGAQSLAVVSLPFTFRFYGQNYDQITVCSNGFLTMGITENANYRNFHIPGEGAPSPLIAPFWDDLSTTGGGIFKWYDATNHLFIIEWYNLKNGFSLSTTETFQVILYDQAYYPTSMGDGPIKIQYNTFNNVDTGSTSTEWSGNYCTVGIQNYDQSTGLEYSFNNQYPTAAAPLSNLKALYITNAPVYYYSPHLTYDSNVVLDNNNNVVEPGETVDINVRLLNIGEQTATNISAVLSSTDPYVTVVSDTSSYAPIAGLATGANSYPFRFSVSGDCPDKHVIPFSINISTDTNNWVRTFSIVVEKPTLIYYSNLVSDTLGNNNGVADPGENFTLIINAKNKSLVDATELFGALGSTYTGVTISNPVIMKPLLSSGEIMQFAYQVSFDQSIAGGASVPFNFNLTSANAPAVNQTVALACGTSGMVLDFESTNGNFESVAGWQYGTPTQTTPHSGMNLWCTGLSGQYPNNAMFVLKTPTIPLGENATFSFWHMMSCQNYFDGGNVSISTNNGDSWTLLYPVAGYNTSLNIQSLGEVGFTNSVAWSQTTFNLSAYANSDVILRWRFASNGTVQGNGWFIDDVMISGYFIKNGIVTGNVTLASQTSPALVKLMTQNRIVTSPDSTGAYAMYLPGGTYEITASLPYHISQMSTPIIIDNQQQMHVFDFSLGYLPGPSGLVLSGPYGQPSVTLTWIEPTEPAYTVTGYNIYRRYNDHPYLLAGHANFATYTENLSLEGTYYYYVRPVYAEGEGEPSNVAEVAFPFVGNGDEPTPVLVNALHANYPNPFNPTTTVSYSLAKSGNVSLRIYNTKGQLVKTLVKGSMKAGQNRIVWDGLNDAGKPVSSGLYFYKLDAPDYSSIRKMLMLK
jgi:hypothetical protein